MSENVLTSFLLDFGRPFWGSSEMQREFPGLLSSGLEQIGKYGIGFFSVFMIAEQVLVITRRSDAAVNDTIVLEFSRGLKGRPILREANTSEQLIDGGTQIRIKLQTDPHKSSGLLYNPYEQKSKNLGELCSSLCPALEVDLFVEEDTETRQIITGGDWKTLNADEFLKRMPVSDLNDNASAEDIDLFRKKAAKNVRNLKDENGRIVGRALITVGNAHHGEKHYDLSGVVTIGGLTACSLTGIAGVLKGIPMRASRDTAKPIVDDDELRHWAEEQSHLIQGLWSDPIHQAACAQYIRLCGGDTGDLPICQNKGHWYSANDIRKSADLPDSIVLIDRFVIDYRFQHVGSYTLNDNVFVVQYSGIPGLLQCRVDWPQDISTYFLSGGGGQSVTLGGAVVESVATAWNVDVQTLRKCNRFEKDKNVVIGSSESGDLKERAVVVSKPQ